MKPQGILDTPGLVHLIILWKRRSPSAERLNCLHGNLYNEMILRGLSVCARVQWIAFFVSFNTGLLCGLYSVIILQVTKLYVSQCLLGYSFRTCLGLF